MACARYYEGPPPSAHAHLDPLSTQTPPKDAKHTDAPGKERHEHALRRRRTWEIQWQRKRAFAARTLGHEITELQPCVLAVLVGTRRQIAATAELTKAVAGDHLLQEASCPSKLF